MRTASLSYIFCCIWAATLLGQTAAPAIEIKYECTAADEEAFGLSCNEDQPCAVFLELSSAAVNGSRLFVTGNLHTRETTLFGLLLASDDNGLTWTEPTPRVRSAAFEQVEFFDPRNGWVSGESIDPLARNPFLLLTGDGGKIWREKLLFEDTKYGAISQFHFTTATSGELVLDTSQGRTVQQELYTSETGGDSWEIKEKSPTRLHLSNVRPSTLRLRADAASNTFKLEQTDKSGGKTWDGIATFAIHVTDCQ